MENRIIIIPIAFIIILSLFSLIGFLSFSMFNKIFYKKKIKNLIYFSLIINGFYLLSFFLKFFINNGFINSLQKILNYYFGFLLYGGITGLIFWLVYFLLKIIKKNEIITKKVVGCFALFLIVSINILAIYNFEKDLAIKNFTFETDKIQKDYSFVQIADTQYGSVSQKHFQESFELAAQQNPDFIVFVGDLVDFDNYKKEDFDFMRDLKVPIFFERGNHEFYHGTERLMSYLEDIENLELLINKKSHFDEIEIVGIDYSQEKDYLKNELSNIEIDSNQFSILLYHEPKDLEEGVKKGFDLILSGHTHGGQIFPFNKLMTLIYKYGSGFYEEDKTKIYTTDGAGLFGPNMRLGSQNEIVLFKLNKI